MNIDAQDVINHLAEQVASQAVQIATQAAMITQLQKDLAEANDG